MSDFNWSVSARDSAALFFESDIMVYVEGESDVLFWDHVISKFTNKKVKVKHLGDKSTLLKYLRDKQPETKYIVAMDSDYDQLFGKLKVNDVLLTYGYSIENTIITPEVIRDLIASHAQVQKSSIGLSYIQSWLEELERAIEKLLAADLQNKESSQEKEKIIPNNASRFFDEKSFLPEVEIISSYLLEKGYKPEGLSCHKKLQRWRIVEIIRGHFLFSAVQVFVKKYLKSKNKDTPLSSASFYAFCINSFEKHFDVKHPHYQYYENAVNIHLTK